MSNPNLEYMQGNVPLAIMSLSLLLDDVNFSITAFNRLFQIFEH